MNKTCKDCIHYDVCQYHITEETTMTVNECSHGFKDKSRYIELPCAVGDTVYEVDKVWGKITERIVLKIRLDYWDIYVHTWSFVYPLSLFGKTVFLTKEDAEKALKGGAE